MHHMYYMHLEKREQRVENTVHVLCAAAEATYRKIAIALGGAPCWLREFFARPRPYDGGCLGRDVGCVW